MTRLVFVMSLGFGVLALTAQHAFSQTCATCAPRVSAPPQLSENGREIRRSVTLAEAIAPSGIAFDREVFLPDTPA